MNVLYLINYAGSGGTEAYVEGLISRLHPQTARCTLCYHIAGPLSERLRARGVAARTAAYYLPNAMIRECIATMALYKKWHLCLLGALAVGCLIGILHM